MGHKCPAAHPQWPTYKAKHLARLGQPILKAVLMLGRKKAMPLQKVGDKTKTKKQALWLFKTTTNNL